jgi:hypothetical protein
VVIALIAPELVIAWAMRQSLVARRLARNRHGRFTLARQVFFFFFYVHA